MQLHSHITRLNKVLEIGNILANYLIRFLKWLCQLMGLVFTVSSGNCESKD